MVEVAAVWSGQRDSNPRHQAWEACTLPLSYARKYKFLNDLQVSVSCCRGPALPIRYTPFRRRNSSLQVAFVSSQPEKYTLIGRSQKGAARDRRRSWLREPLRAGGVPRCLGRVVVGWARGRVNGTTPCTSPGVGAAWDRGTCRLGGPLSVAPFARKGARVVQSSALLNRYRHLPVFPFGLPSESSATNPREECLFRLDPAPADHGWLATPPRSPCWPDCSCRP